LPLLETLLAQPGRFSRARSQEVQLRTSYVSVTVNIDLLNPWRAHQEGTLNANAIGGNTTDCEIGLIAAFPQADDGAANQLDALAFAFDDA
jgi:hypothetical protein